VLTRLEAHLSSAGEIFYALLAYSTETGKKISCFLHKRGTALHRSKLYIMHVPMPVIAQLEKRAD